MTHFSFFGWKELVDALTQSSESNNITKQMQFLNS